MSIVKVLVEQGGHANLDSLPFRFGIHFERDTWLKLSKQENERSVKEGRTKLDADFKCNGEVFRGCFIIAKDKKTVITVWDPAKEKPRDAELLSAVLRLLRKEKRISPYDLVKMHQKFENDKIAPTMDTLLEELVGQGKILQNIGKSIREEATAEYEKEIFEKNEKIAKYENNMESDKRFMDYQEHELEESNKENVILKSNNAEKDKKLKEKDKEIETLKAKEIVEAKASNQTVKQESRFLVRVERGVMHRGSECTMLVFDDDSRKYMKVATFDKDLKITEKAECLVNKQVETTCWDPVNEPGKWSNQGYFRNIYKVVAQMNEMRDCNE